MNAKSESGGASHELKVQLRFSFLEHLALSASVSLSQTC